MSDPVARLEAQRTLLASQHREVLALTAAAESFLLQLQETQDSALVR